MLVKLSDNTFVRFIGEYVYVNNQLSKQDMFLNNTGADFFKEIARTPRSIDDIVNSLHLLYGKSISYDMLYNDFNDFIEEMIQYSFLIKGETIKIINKRDERFSYSNNNLQRFVNRLGSYRGETKDSLQFMREISLSSPQLNGLQFELTSRCNERCIHCYIPNAKKDCGSDLPVEKAISLIDEFANMGGLGVTLSGGEVFLYKDIMKVIQYCRERDLQISILSNLIALKDLQIPILKAANIAVLQVSLYSMNPDVHDEITTIKGSHKRTISAIEKLIAADIPLQIACPIMKANYKGYKDVLRFAQSNKCRSQADFIMMAQSDLCTDNLVNRISLKETEYVIKEILKYDNDYRAWMLLPKDVRKEILSNRDKFSSSSFCGAGRNDLCITSNGDVYPCAGWQGMVVGNVYNSTLESIWNNSEQLNKVRSIKQSDFPKCMDCEVRDYCSPCLMRNFNENNGDMFKTAKHFCDVAHLTKKLVTEYSNSMEKAENP